MRMVCARSVAHHAPATFTGITTVVPAVGTLVYFVCMCLLRVCAFMCAYCRCYVLKVRGL